MEKLKDIIKSYFCIFLITIFTKGINETTGSHHGVGELQDLFSLHSQAEFDKDLPQNVSAIVGQTAFLSCLVRNLKPTQKVSWVRHRDVHILTAGEQTFTSDQRFSSKHNTEDQWVLLIKYVQERDAGIYECQIPTQPPQSYPITLNIIVPHVGIHGSPDLHVNRGSTINLTCVISHTPEPPAYIFWYFNDNVMAYDSPRGGITVVTESGEETKSHLVIRNARQSDEGNYTCKPSILQSASLRLFVIDGDFPAAGLHTSAGESAFNVVTSRLLSLLTLLLASPPH